jgi:hypothetical protein
MHASKVDSVCAWCGIFYRKRADRIRTVATWKRWIEVELDNRLPAGKRITEWKP